MTKIAASQRQEVARKCMAGNGVANVAAEYGVTGACISKILRSLDVQLPIGPKVGGRKPRDPSARELEMAADYKAGVVLQDIGTKHGVTRERVRQILARRFGITKIDGGSAIRCFLNTDKKINSARIKNEQTEARIRKTWDMSLGDYKAHIAEHGSSTDASSPMGKYLQQRKNAQHRGIAWEFTFATWWKVWVDSGKWDRRALSKHGYVMARYGDGDTSYSPENVYICTQSQNAKDSYIVSPHAERFAGCISALAGTGLGYTVTKRAGNVRYRVQFRGRTLGQFLTPEKARSVYLAAANEYAGAQP